MSAQVACDPAERPVGCGALAGGKSEPNQRLGKAMRNGARLPSIGRHSHAAFASGRQSDLSHKIPPLRSRADLVFVC